MAKDRDLRLNDLPIEMILEIHKHLESTLQKTSFYKLNQFFQQYTNFANIRFAYKHEKLDEFISKTFATHLMNQLGIELDAGINPAQGYDDSRSFIRDIIFLDKICWEIQNENCSNKQLKNYEKNYPKENPIIPHLLYLYNQILFASRMENDIENLKKAWQNGNRSALFALCVLTQGFSNEHSDELQQAQFFLADRYKINLNADALNFFLESFSYHFHHAVLLYQFLMGEDRKEYTKLLNKFNINFNNKSKLSSAFPEKIKNLLANLVLELEPIETYKSYIESLLPEAWQLSELPSIQLFKFNATKLCPQAEYVKNLFDPLRDISWESNSKYSLMLEKIEERKDVINRILQDLTHEQIKFLTEISVGNLNLAADILLNWSQHKITNFFAILTIYAQIIPSKNKEAQNVIFTLYHLPEAAINKCDFFKFYYFIRKLDLNVLHTSNRSAWKKIFQIIPVDYLLNKTTESETVQKLLSYDIAKLEKIEAFLNQLKPTVKAKLFISCNYKFDVIVHFEYLLFDYRYNPRDTLKLKTHDFDKITADKSALMWRGRDTFSQWDNESLFYFFGLKDFASHKSILYENVTRFLTGFSLIVVKSLAQSRFLVSLMQDESYNRINLYSALVLLPELGISMVEKLNSIKINQQNSLLEILCQFPPEIIVMRVKRGDFQTLIAQLNKHTIEEAVNYVLPEDIHNYIIDVNKYMSNTIVNQNPLKRVHDDDKIPNKRLKMIPETPSSSEIKSLANNRHTCFYHSVNMHQLDSTIASAKELLTNASINTDAEKVYLIQKLQKLISDTLSANADSQNHKIDFMKKYNI